MTDSTSIEQPFPIFFDKVGKPLDSGYVYIGEYGKNPQTNPIQAFWDEALTQPAVQPIRTINGYYSRYGTPSRVFIQGLSCSITVRDKYQTVVYSELKTSGKVAGLINASAILDDSGLSQQNINDNQKDINSKKIESVDSIADLTSISNPKNGQVVYVKSYHKATNFALAEPFKGGGNFEFVPTRSSENDGVSVFNGWVRLNIGAEIDLYQAGGIDLRDLSGVDNVDAISKVQAYARLVDKAVRVWGWFATSKPVVQVSGDVMLGNGFNNSRFYKTTNDSLPLAGRIAPERVGITDQYNVDAVLIWYADDNSYAGGIETKDIFFQAGSYNDGHPVEYGLYAPRHSACVTENLQFDNVKVAFKANNLFLNRHVNFKSIGSNNGGVNRGEAGVIIYDGEDIMTGTSNTFERFLMVNYQNAYNVQNLQTSEFSKCYGEQIAKSAGAEACVVWTFINPWQITLSNCGQEQTKASAIYVRGNNSFGTKKTLKVVSYQAFWGVGGYSTELYDNLITVDGNVIVSFDSSLILKNDVGFLLNGLFRNNGAIVINNGSILGDSDNSSFSTTRAIQTKDGFSQNTKDVGSDLNNGVEDAVGMSVKPVYGATLNLPSGLSAAWGVSQYFGSNASEGVQIFMSNTSDAIYKRRRTGVSSFTGWTLL